MQNNGTFFKFIIKSRLVVGSASAGHIMYGEYVSIIPTQLPSRQYKCISH